MKINSVYLVSRLIKSGPTNQALNLLSGFDKKRVNAVIVTLSEEDSFSSMHKEFIEKGIEVVQLKRKKWNLFFALFDVVRLVKERNIQLVHSSGLRPDILNILLWNQNVKKCTTQRCDPKDILNFYSSTIVSFIYVLVIRRFHRIIACSEALSRILYEKYNLKTTFVCNGVDTTIYYPLSRDEKIALRNKYNIPDEKRIYVVLGSLIHRKNVLHIIKSFHLIHNDDVHLLIVGGGPLQKELEEKAAGLNITFTGNVAIPLPYIQMSDIMISASLAEGLPNSVLEGLACGLPILFSDITPHQEIYCRDTAIGELFSNDKVEYLVEAVQKTFKWDLEEKKRIVRDMVETNFSKYVTARAYEDQYISLISE